MLIIPDYVVWQNVEGELALFDSRDGSYHALNGSAAEVWRELATTQDTGAIVERLAREYDASADEIAADVASFIHWAEARGLLAERAA